jgi:hypothetical protein
MKHARSGRLGTLIGAVILALTVGVMALRSTRAPKLSSEELRDAVAAPISPALLGGARVVSPDAGYFASPSGRRAEAERALTSSRMTRVSKTARASFAQ